MTGRSRLARAAVACHTPRSGGAPNAALIRLTAAGMEGKESKPANPAAESIRRNTPRGYSDLHGLKPILRNCSLQATVRDR